MTKRQHEEVELRLDELEGFENIGTKGIGNFYLPISFQNRYHKSHLIGSGGYGTVIVLEMNDAQHLAVKRFNKAFDSANIAKKCFRELQLLKAVKHEHIVKMKFVHTTEETMESLNSVYLTEDYCGLNLAFVLDQETKAKKGHSLKSFQRMISELLRALKYLNSANVIHRDLKPDNLAINGQGNLTLLDFGMARVIHENLQHTNEPGTAYFRAIETIEFNVSERINGRRRVYNEKADMWSIGAILCQMLTGKMIFEGDHPLLKAISICGPVPDNVIDEVARNRRRVSARNGKNLLDFINSTLDWDHRKSVGEALAHAFLAGVRERKKEVNAEIEPFPDVGDDQTTIEQWKQHIWEIIQQSPVDFNEPVLT